MIDWQADRTRLGARALLLALLTAFVLWALDMAGTLGVFLPVLYLAVAAIGLVVPAAIAAQVVLGQLLVGVLLIGDGVGFVTLLLPMAGVIGTAELLAAVARLDQPVRRDAEGGVLGSAGTAVALGCAAFAVVALAASAPGIGGVIGIGMAASACLLVALGMGRVVG